LREHARAILKQRRFRGRHTPGPFRGVVRAVADGFAAIGRALAPVGRFFDHFAWLWTNTVARLFLVLGVAAIVAALSLVVIRRRSAVAVGRGGARRALARDDPSRLDRQAEEAEARGDYATGVRLRFIAGVIRLQDAGRVRRGRTTATRAIGRQLHSEVFDDLGDTFDAVAYGGRPATSDDATQARDAWRRVLAEPSS
jgi:hypothetical protein